MAYTFMPLSEAYISEDWMWLDRSVAQW